MLQFFGYLSGILVSASFLPYIKDIFQLKTKPQRTTFFIWSLLGGIAFFSQLAKGASYSFLLSALSVGKLDLILLIYPLYIFAANASIFLAIKFGYRKINKK